MSEYTLNVSEDVYTRAQRISAETSQPVEQILIDHLKMLPDLLPALPLDEQAELDALHHLSDDTLWTIAREQMPPNIHERMQILMDKNNFGTITDDEYRELEAYVERAIG